MKITLPDFQNATVGNEPLVDGIYTVNVPTSPTREMKGDKVSLKFTFKVVAGPDQKSPGENGTLSPIGRELHDFIPLQANCMWRMKRLLVAAGLMARDDKSSALAMGEFDTDSLIGNTFQVKVFQEEYEGKKRTKVDYVL